MANILTAVAVLLVACNVLSLTLRLIKLEKQVDDLMELLSITEYRCMECTERTTCPAAYTGVFYPCEHFRKEDPK